MSMHTEIYIDPKIDMNSDNFISILIEFKVKPAKVAVATSVSNITMEQAKQMVEVSHHLFQKELAYLNKQQIRYTVNQAYKNSFNGVSVRLKGNTIKYFLQSTVIKAIYRNQEMDIPKRPVDTRYQI